MTTTKTSYIILIILLVAALVGVAVGAYLTNGFRTSDVKSVVKNTGEFRLSVTTIKNEEHFEVDVINGGKFTVSVVQNPAANFEYRIDDIPRAFLDNSVDWNKAFGLTVGESSFSLNTSRRSLQDLLLSVYNGLYVTGYYLPKTDKLFEIIVVSESGQVKTIPLNNIYIITDVYFNDGLRTLYI